MFASKVSINAYCQIYGEMREREQRKKTFAHEEVDIFNIEMHKAFSAFHTGSIRTCNIRIETAYFC